MLKQVSEGVFTHLTELLRNNAIVLQCRTGVLLIDPGITCSGTPNSAMRPGMARPASRLLCRAPHYLGG
jgi:hypothetical protein